MQRIAIQSAGGPLLGCQVPGCIVSSKLEYVEQAVLREIQKEFDKLCANAEQKQQESQIDYAAMAKSIDAEISTAHQQLGRLYDLVEQGVYTIEVFNERRGALLRRISALEDERKNLVPPQQLDLEKMRANIEAVFDAYPTADFNTKNQLLKSIIDKIVYNKQKGVQPKGFTLEVFLHCLYL